MQSRTGERAIFDYTTLEQTVPAELVKKLTGFYLPWIEEALKCVDDELTWKRPKPGVNSIGNLLLHLEGNVRQWIIHGLGGAEDTRNRDAEFSAETGPDKNTLFRALNATANQACEVILLPRNDSDWQKRLTVQGFETTAIAACLHVTEHFAYHTGQIVTMVKSTTGKDLKFYNL